MSFGKKKTKKANKANKEPKISTHFIMRVILPCVTLACKDTFNASEEQLKEFCGRVNRYMGYLADKTISLSELEELVTVRDSSN